MPERPSLYPAGSVFYRAVITFEVEILDAKLVNKMPDQSARGGSSDPDDVNDRRIGG